MTVTVFFKECKKTVKSITYLLFVAVLILFTFTQLGSELTKIKKPQPGQESYGTKNKEIPEIIMPNAVKSLYNEFTADSYTAYPVGFYKNVKLNDNKQVKMAEILSKLSGLSVDGITPASDAEGTGMAFSTDSMTSNDNGSFQMIIPEKHSEKLDITVDKALSYEQFRILMKQADELIGGGSYYDEIYLIRFGETQMTYEEALSDYNDIVEKDKITGAYARLFCDYMGIVLAVMPVFIAVAAGIKDRRARMQELIYSRKISSLKLIFIRYISMITIMFLPVLILALHYAAKTAGDYAGLDIDNLAFIKYSFGWLLPTLMVSVSVGVFLTELTDTPIAIAVQGLWWFLGLFNGRMSHMHGGYCTDLALSHNTVGATQVYLDNFNILLANRIVYTCIALTLILITVWIYEMKRRGMLNAYEGFKKIFTHRGSKSEA